MGISLSFRVTSDILQGVVEVNEGGGSWEGRNNRLPIESFHAILYCRKWSECVSFYRDVLGFPVVFANESFVELQPMAGSCIGLMDATRTKRSAYSPHDDFVLSFRVSDVEMTHKMLLNRHQGISELKNHPWGARLFGVKDPEGRLLEFWSPRD